MNPRFKRERHIYTSDTLDAIIQDALGFFSQTPVVALPPTDRFAGTGVYALYYVGSNSVYREISNKNKLELLLPIYVGKAVPRGWRQARQARLEDHQNKVSFELLGRLREHTRSIKQVQDLEIADFFLQVYDFRTICK